MVERRGLRLFRWRRYRAVSHPRAAARASWIRLDSSAMHAVEMPFRRARCTSRDALPSLCTALRTMGRVARGSC